MMGQTKDTRTLLVSALLILLVGGGFLFQRFWQHRSENKPLLDTIASQDEDGSIPIITSEIIRQKIANGENVHLLDLRDEESFKAEHIPHSVSLSPSGLASFQPNPDELTVIVYAAGDTQMLEIIKNSLRQKSSKAFLLEGGFEDWKRRGNQVISFGDPNSFIDQSKVIFIPPAEALALLKDPNQQTFLLDVQSEANYQKKHLRNAKNIPLDQLEKRFREIPPSTMVLVYGESELISFQGGVRLSDLGIITTKTLSGNDNLGPSSLFVLQP